MSLDLSRFHLGCPYYPEHWPEARWAEDARWMRGLGLTVTRMAEFAWALLEPSEDRFDFAWLDRAVDVFAAEGFQILLGTPTAAPPMWLARRYPDILPVDDLGRRRNVGGRRHYCPNSPTYRTLSRRIARAMGMRYASHPAVVGWQIDNEFGVSGSARCYCEHCVAAFRTWLIERYRSLDARDLAWGTVCWAQHYEGGSHAGPASDPPIRAGAKPACFGTEVAHAVGTGIAAISAFTGLACVATTIDPRFGAILYAIAAREIVIATASPGTARWRVYSAGLCVLPCTAVLP